MNPLPSILRAALLATALLCAFGGVARAQTPTPTPSEEELQLQEQKRLLELQRDIEQAKKAIRDAQPQPTAAPTPPAPTATPLAGDTTLENVKLESEMVSYAAMSKAVDAIADEVKNKVGASDKNIPALSIYDAQVVRDWRFYQALFPAFDGQVRDILNRYTILLCQRNDLDPNFKRDFCENNQARTLAPDREVFPQLVTTAIPAAFGAGTNLLKSFIDLAALFRTDTKITGNAVTIDQSALVAEVFRALRNKYNQQINLYYPGVFPPRPNPPPHAEEKDKYSHTVTTIGALFLARIQADKIIEAQNDAKKNLSDSIKDKVERKNDLGAKLKQVDEFDEELKQLIKARDTEDDAAVTERLQKEIAEVSAKKHKLGDHAMLKAQIDAIDAETLETRNKIKAIGEVVDELTELNKRFQSFVDEFIKVDANGVNALALFVRAEDIENAMRESNSYWLEIKSVTAGGNNRVRKNLLRYFSGAKLDHSGGVIIEYTLYNKEGAVILSDKYSYYGGYVEPKHIPQLLLEAENPQPPKDSPPSGNHKPD